MRLRLLGLLLVAAAGCTSPLDLGERRYRAGDRLGALETWRSIPRDSADFEAAERRSGEVEREFEQLVVRYKQRGRYYEQRGRLAEAVLNYRLVLKLRPRDRPTLDHVQSLVRLLQRRKVEAQRDFATSFAAGALADARTHLARVQRLDPFDPELPIEERRLDDALRTTVESLLARGRLGFSSGDHQSAERAFGAVLELDPENGTARGYLSYISTIRAEEHRRGPTEPSLDAPQIYATEGEIRAEGFYQNALVAERAGDPYAAIEHDLRALALNGGHVAAGVHLDALRRRLSSEIPGLLSAGRSHYQEEDLQSALDQWRRAVLIDPDNRRAREYVARAERLLRNLEQLRAEPDAAVSAR